MVLKWIMFMSGRSIPFRNRFNKVKTKTKTTVYLLEKGIKSCSIYFIKNNIKIAYIL